jgi:pyruvate kinase
MRRTKIMVTVGPACDGEETLLELIRAGVDVARINFSHGTHADHSRRIALVRALARRAGREIPVLGDLQGPKWRIGPVADGFALLAEGAELRLTSRAVPGDAAEIQLPHVDLIEAMRPNQRLLLDDGLIELQGVAKEEEEDESSTLRCRVVYGGSLSSHKGVSAPGAHLTTPALTEKDREDVVFAVAESLDYLALSFVKRRADVELLRELLAQAGARRTPIVAKIETCEALENFDSILEVADAVMVARGDLGVETPSEEVPFAQKDLIRRCNERGCPVITATQMLNSMIISPRPTRAETADVANSVLDGTSAVMLSAETASGKYPVESVRRLARIAAAAEKHIPYGEIVYAQRKRIAGSAAEAVAQAAVVIAYELGLKAIVTATQTGRTARLIAKSRPNVPIVAVTPNERVCRQLHLLWGVLPQKVPEFRTTDQLVLAGVHAVLRTGLVEAGDAIVLVASSRPGTDQGTNLLKIHTISGEVEDRGE